MMKEWIERYAQGAEVPANGIRGLTPQDRIARPVPNTWSIQEIVLHLMDSDLIGADRMKRVIAEENPSLIGYNETAFANNLFYHELDAEAACKIFAMNRWMTVEILRRLPESAFARKGIHNEAGEVTLATLLETYVNHLAHHMRFLEQKRAMLGKPL
ncbi:MAG: DinB family protein [Planctomycetota bacterium]